MFRGLVLGGGGGGGGRPDYLQKLKVPEGYEKKIDYSNIWHGTRLYRSKILQENMRLKALAEIYTMHYFAQL